MLTWASLNVIGGTTEFRKNFEHEQDLLEEAVETEILRLGIETKANGDRAKVHLYCLEVVDPHTGWLVPAAPSWIISETRGCIARLKPDYTKKRFDIEIATGCGAKELREAGIGTIVDSHLVYRLRPSPEADETVFRVSVGKLRGDGVGAVQADGSRSNLLRKWSKQDIAPLPPSWDKDKQVAAPECGSGAWVGGDVWQERLYAIQWMTRETASSHRKDTYFAGPTDEDLAQEAKIAALVRSRVQTHKVHQTTAATR